MQSLRDLIDELDTLPDDETIYSRDASPTARAVAAREPDSGGLPTGAEGLSYLVEVRLAKEAVRVWSEWRDGAAPTSNEKVAAVIHYAATDSFLPASGIAE